MELRGWDARGKLDCESARDCWEGDLLYSQATKEFKWPRNQHQSRQQRQDKYGDLAPRGFSIPSVVKFGFPRGHKLVRGDPHFCASGHTWEKPRPGWFKVRREKGLSGNKVQVRQG